MRLLLCLCLLSSGAFAPPPAFAAPAVTDRVEELKAQLKSLEKRLASGTLTPAEAVKVRAEIEKIRLLLAQSLGRSSGTIQVPKKNRAADAAALLRAAAAVPADAAWVFDNSRSSQRSIVFAPFSPSARGARLPAPPAGTPVEAEKQRALREFLRDVDEYRPIGAVSTTLTADDQSHYRLIFERADKSRRVIFGEFLPGTTAGGQPGPLSFIVMGSVEIPPSGQQGAHSGYWREYTGAGRRLEWSSTADSVEEYWGPWKSRKESRAVWLAEQSWRDGRWQTEAKNKIKTVLTNQGKSWFARAEDVIMEAPVIGPALKASNKIAAAAYTAMIGGVQYAAARISKSDIYSLEAGGTFAKNPFLNKVISDERLIASLSPDARQELYLRVESNRRRVLDAGLYPMPPELRRQVIHAPIEAKEAVEALRAGYGASTYDRRLIQEADHHKGWRSWAMIGGGMFVGAVESVAESVFNPMLWAKIGAEKAVAALKKGGTAAGASFSAKAAYNASRAADAATTTAWVAPWALNMTDSGGKMLKHTAEGKFDKEYFRKLGEAGANAFYLFVLP